MNELNQTQIDQTRFDQNIPMDTRKPFRQFVDDKLIPYGGAMAAVPLGIAGGIVNIASKASLTPKEINIAYD